jgi:hypothetical protein
MEVLASGSRIMRVFQSEVRFRHANRVEAYRVVVSECDAVRTTGYVGGAA